MSEPSDIEILRRNAAQIRRGVKRAEAWMVGLTLGMIAIVSVVLVALVIALAVYDPPGGLAIGLCAMTLIFIGGMHDKVKVQRTRLAMLFTVLDKLEADVRALGGKP